MIRKSILCLLSLLALTSGVASLASYSKQVQRLGTRHSMAAYVHESRGLMFMFRPGTLTFHYCYPEVGNALGPHPGFPSTFVKWLGYLDATSICDKCRSRYRPSESCPRTNDVYHHDLTSGRSYIPYHRQRDMGVVFWGTNALGLTRWNSLTVSLSFSFVLFAAYPIFAFIRGPLRRWRRRKIGHCAKCGYNLFGNESGICPECGTKVQNGLPTST